MEIAQDTSIDLNLVKASYDPPHKLDSSAAIFTSPKKKNPKRRRRKIDVEREEIRRKIRKQTHDQFQSNKDLEIIDKVELYSMLDFTNYLFKRVVLHVFPFNHLSIYKEKIDNFDFLQTTS